MYRFRVVAQSRLVLAAWVASSIELSRKRYGEHQSGVLQSIALERRCGLRPSKSIIHSRKKDTIVFTNLWASRVVQLYA